MNILYTVDDNFVPQLAAGICSVCENNQASDDITFYVFSDGISKSNQEKLCMFVDSYERNLHLVDIAGFMDTLGFDFDTSGWNEIVMARLLMARFLPEKIDRILYLDGDTIVRRSLDKLWNMDLDDFTLAASMEPTADRARRSILGLENEPYYNAGVLLVNLRAWRNGQAEQRLLEYCRDNGDLLFANDQDAINVVLAGSIATISPTYNYCNIYSAYPYDMMQKLTLPCEYIGKDAYAAARANPHIIHYLGEERPWRKGNKHEYRMDYKTYLDMTPWANAPMDQGWQAYYLAWNAFNALTKPIPIVRYKIINSLIPAFMKLRKSMRTR